MPPMNVWPTDGAAGSVATEARWRAMARHWAPSGIAAGIGGEMAPSLTFPNLTVQSGACWVDGHYCELPTNQVLTATANGLAVVRFDPAANSAELLWRDGVTTPTQSPTGTWELPIARTVGSALGDLRVNSLTQSQTIPRFASAAARTSRIPVPVLNQQSMLDTRPGVIQFWNGSSWVDISTTNPPDPLLHQYGTVVVTTDAYGSANITWPTPYASGATRGVMVINGDASAASPLYSFWVGILNPGNTGSGCTVVCTSTSGPIANTFVRVNYIVTGARP